MNSTSFDVSLAYTSFISDFSMYLFYKWISLILSKLVSLVVVSDFYPILVSLPVVSDHSLCLFQQWLSAILSYAYFNSGR